jgi:hypothetical protein
MNERIKQLKEQSMEWVPNMADPDTKIRLLNAEKFAELIVRECADIAKHNVMNISTYADADFVNAQIKKHFGVEE